MKICVFTVLLLHATTILCFPSLWKLNLHPESQANIPSVKLLFTHDNRATPVTEGDTVFIGYMTEDQICCRPDITGLPNLSDYQVTWQNQHGDIITRWSPKSRVFSLGGKHIPHSYLVVTDFTQNLSGAYTCVLWYREKKVAEAHVFVEDSFWRKVPRWLRILL